MSGETSLTRRLNYYRRIFSAYLGGRNSQLTFWHEIPRPNEQATTDRIGQYYMPFASKADYRGSYDADGIPLLDYRGVLGHQYNPIAIAQFALGNYNLYKRTGSAKNRAKFLLAADWLVANLETNRAGLKVWHHHFDWDYRETLSAPWYSGLAQGQGISALVRAHEETQDPRYMSAAEEAFPSLTRTIDQGGVLHVDEDGNPWIEEYVVSPPTHILNGFIWATWGVYDYWLATGEPRAEELFSRTVETLKENMHQYDIRYWSLYEQSGTRLKMVASPFYHSLHIAQLQVLQGLTGEDMFGRYASRWSEYRSRRVNRALALAHKATFKLLYY